MKYQHSLVPRLTLAAFFAAVQNTRFSMAAKKAARGGLGTRPVLAGIVILQMRPQTTARQYGQGLHKQVIGVHSTKSDVGTDSI